MSKIIDFLSQKNTLKTLDISGQNLTEIPKEVLEFPKLEVLNLSKNKITDIPEWLNKLSSLENLNLDHNSIKKIEYLPHNLLQLSVNNNNLTEIDTNLKLEQLFSISLKNNQLTQFPIELLEKSKNLYSLDLNNNHIKRLSQKIGKFHNLSFLSIVNNQLTELPEEIAESERLSQLLIGLNQLSELPDIFTKLSQLNTLGISKNPLKKLPKSLLQNNSISDLSISEIDFEELPFEFLFQKSYWRFSALEVFEKNILEERESFIKGFKNHQLSNSELEILYHISLCDNTYKCDLKWYFEALKYSIPILQKNALNYLLAGWEDQLQINPLKKGSVITILGKTNFQKKLLKEQLTNPGLSYATKITPKTSHVILAKGVKTYLNYDQEGLTFLPEKALKDFLDNAEEYYLDQENTPQNEIRNVGDLLLSFDPDSVNIGLEMLMNLGGTDQLITELFLVSKNSALFPSKIRNKAKKLLFLHCSERLKSNFEEFKSSQILPARILAQKNIIQNLSCLTREVDYEVDFGKVTLYLYVN